MVNKHGIEDLVRSEKASTHQCLKMGDLFWFSRYFRALLMSDSSTSNVLHLQAKRHRLSLAFLYPVQRDLFGQRVV